MMMVYLALCSCVLWSISSSFKKFKHKPLEAGFNVTLSVSFRIMYERQLSLSKIGGVQPWCIIRPNGWGWRLASQAVYDGG
ncbi:hypothetical protein L1887_03504 [Cichorium endivia]|nr:hypothetical protein L1887_03504 [Cichorium endivia]